MKPTRQIPFIITVISVIIGFMLAIQFQSNHTRLVQNLRTCLSFVKTFKNGWSGINGYCRISLNMISCFISMKHPLIKQNLTGYARRIASN